MGKAIVCTTCGPDPSRRKAGNSFAGLQDDSDDEEDGMINYRDAVLEAGDARLFSAPHWLNDRCLHFGFKLLEDDLGEAGCVLMDPAVYSFMMLQCEDDDEFEDLGRGLAFARDKPRVVATAVSDAEALVVGGSSHWSLLMYHVDEDRAAHYDSMGSTKNVSSAAKAAKQLARCFRREAPTLDHAPTPRQTNGHDCGAFALAVAGALLRGQPVADVTPAAVAALRADYRARADAMLAKGRSP